VIVIYLLGSFPGEEDSEQNPERYCKYYQREKRPNIKRHSYTLDSGPHHQRGIDSKRSEFKGLADGQEGMESLVAEEGKSTENYSLT
jgi:hypothetical protein